MIILDFFSFCHRKPHIVCITKNKLLLLFTKIIAVYSDNSKHINTQCYDNNGFV